MKETVWLDHGTYVGMPEGYQDAPNVQVSLCGTREGQYVSRTAYLVQDHVLYRISMNGDPNLQDLVQETLENVLSEFENV